MGARGKQGNNRHKGKFKNNRNLKTKRNVKQRKTFSLYKLKQQRDKVESNDSKPVKKPEEIKPERVESEESSTESEEEDPMDQLLQSFGNDLKRKKELMAIESSDDSSVEDVEMEQNEPEVVNNQNDEESSIATANDNELSEEQETEENELQENAEDPFSLHLSYELSSSLLQSVQNTPISVDNFTEHWPCLGKLAIQIPKCDEEKPTNDKSFSIIDEQKSAPSGKVPTICKTSEDSHIKTQILDNIRNANQSRTGEPTRLFTPLQNEIFSIINNYQDFYYPHRTFENAEEIRFAYCVHAVNHILKTRMKVIHHNAKLSKKDDVPEEFRDQGLVRPKVLIIVPFKDAAYRIIEMIISILVPTDKGNVMNKNRFIQDYTGSQLVMPKKNPKPEDYEALFCGNTSDDFKMGMTVTKKSLKVSK